MWSLDCWSHIFLVFFPQNLWCTHQIFLAKNSKQMIIFGQQLSSNHIECVHFLQVDWCKQNTLSTDFFKIFLYFLVSSHIYFLSKFVMHLRFFKTITSKKNDYFGRAIVLKYIECVQIFASWCKKKASSTDFFFSL